MQAMKNTINLFMWAYQPHFRLAMIRRARNVLKLAGADLEPRALLVGVRHAHVEDRHPVCVEPEDGEWDPTFFFGCARRADEIEPNHPDQNLFYGDEARMRDKPENIRRRSVLQAVQEILGEWDTSHETISFCGSAMRLDAYHVVPVLQFRKADLGSIPRLASPIRWQDFASPAGLFEAIIERLLQEAAAALQWPEPGRYFQTLDSDPTSLLREAADRLCAVMTLSTRDVSFQGIFDALNAISDLRYEGTESRGRILFVPKGTPALRTRFQLLEPQSLYRPRLARKVIEMSGEDLACLCHGESGIAGLGDLGPDTDTAGISVRFTGHFRWDLMQGAQILMRVSYGVPKLPTSRLKKAEFAQYVTRRFADMTPQAVEVVWSVVEAALEQKHGTMVVVSAGADVEARRLKTQALPIQPAPLTPAVVANLTKIDGAVLLDSKGHCYAVGVILDGLATSSGDPARGARYNSAIRYVASASVPTVCIVVSEDGDVDLVPKYRPGIKRADIVSRLSQLKNATADNYMKPYSWLEDHRFYLTDEECAEANLHRERILAAPQELGEIRIVHRDLEPDPEMDSSFYVSEDGGP
jgi:hypothetical protein